MKSASRPCPTHRRSTRRSRAIALAALHGTVGVLTALYHRKVNGGQGQVIDVALHEAVFNVMESLVPEYSAFGVVREPAGSALPGIAPSNAYRCGDNGVVLIAGNGDSIFKRLMTAIGRDDFGRDPTLCDTTGMAYPTQVARLTRAFRERLSNTELTLHFHNTHGMGLANVLAGIDAGTDRFDASFGGIGGCPYAPGATGNVCTEEIVHALELMGFDTGVDLAKLIEASKQLPALIGHDIPSQLSDPAPRRGAAC